MLNCCIERKMKREQFYKGYTGDLDSPKEESEGHDSGKTNQSGTKKQSLTKTPSDKRTGSLGQRTKSDSSIGEKPSKVPHLEMNSSSDDEFFECDEMEMEVDSAEENADKTQTDTGHQTSDDGKISIQEESGDSLESSNSGNFKDSLSHRPEGRLAAFGIVQLRETGEQMYIPITQEPAPLTEDMLEEQAEILAR